MSVFFNNALAGASGQGGGAYEISRSVRFNAADSAYLSRTPGSAGNRKTYTLSLWLKRSVLGTNQNFFGRDSDSGFYFQFTPTDNISVIDYNDDAGADWRYTTTAVYRDTSAWYHITLSVDTTLATASDRVKLYVNGDRITQFSTATDPSLNFEGAVNKASAHVFGRISAASAWYFNGYLADIHFIDGQALTPSSFGEFDTNGVWQPKAYSGTYGTNGFRLDFSDNSAATATTLGKDRSPNGNNFTPNNLSVTAGAGNDSLVDSPTNYGSDTGAGGQVRGNYCTLNPLSNNQNILANGNLDTVLTSNGVIGRSFGTLQLFDNCYWEVTVGPNSLSLPNANYIWNGIAQKFEGSAAVFAGNYTYEYAYRNDGAFVNNSSTLATYSTYTFNSVISYAYSGGKLFIAVNGTWQNSGNPVAGTGSVVSGLTGLWFPFIAFDRTNVFQYFNGGQRAFSYTAPSGFKALCTQNLPTPTITKGNTAMDVVLYTGTGAALTPTSALGFSPDFVWIKGRSGATDHALYDIVRGATKDLVSNSTAAETTQTQGLTAFNSNGFSVGTLAKVNTNAATYAAWAFDAGSSTVTNTAGTISSQVRANASAGFSVVAYTGTSAGTFSTVGHGLGVKPALLIVKNRDSASNWLVYHSSVGATKFLVLNSTTAETPSGNAWYNTEPTSSVFTLTDASVINSTNNKAVAYCFAPVAGYSAFGSYVGNGSANGPMVFCNFRPAFVLIKSSSVPGDWQIFDSKRNPINGVDGILNPNYSVSENSGVVRLDFTSNGFKIRITGSDLNDSGATYIYAAFAEHPFSLARAR